MYIVDTIAKMLPKRRSKMYVVEVLKEKKVPKQTATQNLILWDLSKIFNNSQFN